MILRGPKGPLFHHKADGVLAYVTNTSDNTISVIDTTTNTVVATVLDGNSKTGRVLLVLFFVDQKLTSVQELSSRSVVSSYDDRKDHT